MSLSPDELRAVQGALPGTDKVNFAAVARLYRSRGGEWEFLRVGAVAATV